MTNDDLKFWVYVAMGAGGLYLAYQLYLQLNKVPGAVGTAAAAASSSVADAAQAILGTGVATPGQSYTVTMADGSVQTVPYGQLPVPLSGYGSVRRRGRYA